MTKTETSLSTTTYDDVIIKPKRKEGKADLVINHQNAKQLAKMYRKNLKNYGDGIISYKPSDEDEFCSFKIRKIKFRSDKIIIKGKKGDCESLPVPSDSTTISFAWGYDSFSEAEKAREEYLDLFSFTELNNGL